MSAPPATPAQAAALDTVHAVMCADTDRARRLIAAMTAAERATLAHCLVRVRALLAERVGAPRPTA